MTRRHNITQPDVRCRFAPRLASRRDCRDLSQNTTPRNRLRPVLMPRPLENKRLARAAVRGATLLLPSPNRSRLLPTSVTLLGGRTLAIARFGWGGVRDGGRRMWHACATASRPPTPSLPHKGGGSSGCPAARACGRVAGAAKSFAAGRAGCLAGGCDQMELVVAHEAHPVEPESRLA